MQRGRYDAQYRRPSVNGARWTGRMFAGPVRWVRLLIFADVEWPRETRRPDSVTGTRPNSRSAQGPAVRARGDSGAGRTLQLLRQRRLRYPCAPAPQTLVVRVRIGVRLRRPAAGHRQGKRM